MKKKYALIISLILTFILAFFYNSIFSHSSEESVIVERAIDGDTIQLEDGRKVRLSNINAPEKGEYGYLEAYNFLKNYENESVKLEINGVERYGRLLGEIYSPEYVNLELVELGLVHYYLVEEKKLKQFKEKQDEAMKSELGIWKKSEDYGCLEVNIDKKKELVFIDILCDIEIKDWTLKDESTNSYKFPDINTERIVLHSEEGKDVGEDFYWGRGNSWNDDKDSIFIRDEKGLLVYYDSYGY